MVLVTAPRRITVERAVEPTAEIAALVAALDDEIAHDFDERQRHGLRVVLFASDMRFFVARDTNGAIAGCGGLLLADGFAEVKRMYVVPAFRGRGVGRAILDHLVEVARAEQRSLLCLETGNVLVDAVRLYARYGFVERLAFPPYDAMSSFETDRSVFMELRI